MITGDYDYEVKRTKDLLSNYGFINPRSELSESDFQTLMDKMVG